MKKTLLFTLCLTTFSLAQAQIGRVISNYRSGKSRWYYHSLQIGVNAVMPTKSDFTLTFNYPETHPTAAASSRVYQASTRSNTLFMGHAAIAVNLMTFNQTSGIALTVGFEGFAQASELIDEFYPNNMTKTNLNFLQMNFGLPIGLAFKTGGEFSHDKADRLSFTGGFGMAPTFSVFSLSSYGSLYERANMNLLPFVFAEVGIFGGVKWKLRASVHPAGFYRSFDKTIVNNDVSLYGSSTRIQYANSGAGVQLGIAVMPFSFGWYDGRW